MKLLKLLPVIGLFVIVGCGAESSPGPIGSRQHANSPPPPPMELEKLAMSDRDSGKELSKAKAANGEAAVPKPIPRKIIYTAAINLIVKDFDGVEKSLADLVRSHDGYIAQSDINGSAGSPRSGTWKVRVPVERFQSFVDGVVNLGIPEKNTTDSKDVSEEYYDLQARIKNKKIEEQRLIKLLDDVTGKLDEILKVEQELTRVRGEVERLEGSMRVLSNLTELTTITVSVREVRDYVPPQTPTFAADIGTTFHRSLDSLIEFGKGLTLIIVALSPWIPVMVLAAFPVLLTVRHVRRRGAG